MVGVDDLYTLQIGVLALVILMAMLTVYHLLFRRANFSWRRLELLQDRMRFASLALVFLLPIYWLSLKIPDLNAWYPACQAALGYAVAMTGCEFILCFLLDSSAGPRVGPVIQRLVRLPIYGIPGLIVASFALGLPILDVNFQARVGAVVLLYLALHMSYVYIFRELPWQHPLTKVLVSRLRLWVYAVLIGEVTYFASLHLGVTDLNSAFTLYFRASVGFLMASVVAEGILVCTFDYYFPEIRRIEVPHLFRDLARGVCFLAVLAFTAIVFLKKDPSSVLVSSAVLSVAIGFALQETLGNFFAGLALRLARPYTLGDRVQIMQLTGQVQKIDWRSTAIVDTVGDLIIIPNSKLAQEPIINHSSPVRTTGRYIEVGLHYRHVPNQCKKVLLEACLSVPDVMREPAPQVFVLSFDDSSIKYRLLFFIADFSQRFRIDSLVREAIWYHVRRHDMEIPYPTRSLYVRKPDQGIDAEHEVRSLLDQVDFFKELAKEDLQQLARRAHFDLYAAGEKVCIQGEAGDSFYIIKNGRLEVSAVDSEGDVFLSLELKAGQYFGEMALLTGEPRSATVKAQTDSELIRLGKEDLRHILRVSPQVEEMISKVLAQRKMQTQQARVEAEEERISRAMAAGESAEGVEQLTQQFLRKIRDFFSY